LCWLLLLLMMMMMVMYLCCCCWPLLPDDLPGRGLGV
jgi:hypothetical protein